MILLLGSITLLLHVLGLLLNIAWSLFIAFTALTLWAVLGVYTFVYGLFIKGDSHGK